MLLRYRVMRLVMAILAVNRPLLFIRGIPIPRLRIHADVAEANAQKRTRPRVGIGRSRSPSPLFSLVSVITADTPVDANSIHSTDNSPELASPGNRATCNHCHATVSISVAPVCWSKADVPSDAPLTSPSSPVAYATSDSATPPSVIVRTGGLPHALIAARENRTTIAGSEITPPLPLSCRAATSYCGVTSRSVLARRNPMIYVREVSRVSLPGCRAK
jgi:hypothetical protein